MRRLDGRTIFRAFRAVQKTGLDLFSPEVLVRLTETPGWASLRLPARNAVGTAQVSLLEALRALAVMNDADTGATADARVVGTLPTRVGGIEDTRATIRSLLQQARRDILVVGFSISDHDLIDVLHRRAMAGIAVTVVGDRRQGRMDEMKTHWPAIGNPPRLLHNVEPGHGDPYSMHAKVLVIDGQQALVGSANFTMSGMSRNIELGVIVEGQPVSDIMRAIDQLASDGWLVPL